MMGGKRPLSPREAKRLQARMKQIELDGVEEVIIRFADKETVIYNPTVVKAFIPGMMESDTYQVMGAGTDRPKGSDSAAIAGVQYTDSDVELIVSQTDATEDEARKALEEEDGDLAGAIVRLKTKK
ncbi:MAG: Nascent polypeptide-associated complex protein [Candidatus Heimdallarchaeota archaeon]|nr:Nascent polypeptide-associated complex protein [Candidatus Heimdallarchaeota archaeon]MCK4954389.1 Nascent polypeptide-associated complex protein [Candidatus Heimdallarchaeota archaeon]